MSQQIINVGSSPNDGLGDPLRTAYTKCNNNFTELYANITRPQSMGDGGSNITVGYPSGPILFRVNDVANVMVVSSTGVSINGLANVIGGASITGNAIITGTTTLAGNASVFGNITTGGIKTDGYYWANGSPINFGAAGGSNTQVVYNNAGNAAGSPAFTFNQQTNAVSMLGTLYVAQDTVLNGNLLVNGNTVTANTTTLNVQDPIIGLGRGANNTPLAANDGKDRGEQLWYYTTTEQSAFTGYQNASGKILLATDVTITNEIVTVNTLGNVVLGNAEPTAVSASGNVTGANFNTAGVVSASGNVRGANFNTTGIVSASGNVIGANFNTTGIVTATSISVSGNIDAGNIIGNVSGTAANAAYATLAGTAYSVSGANVVGLVANAAYATTAGTATTATTAGTVTTAAQPNITSVGTLSSLTVSGNVTASYFVGTATTAQYADLAEMYSSDYPYEPGTVVSFGGEQEVTLSLIDHDRAVAGVVSTSPAHLMNSHIDCEHALPIALQGRVPCKVRGPVLKGQMMISAGDGYARAELQPSIGAVIGKALQNFTGNEGIIEVVVGRI